MSSPRYGGSSALLILRAKFCTPWNAASASCGLQAAMWRGTRHRPSPLEPVPPATARGARAAFPAGHRYRRRAEALETLVTAEACGALCPTPGHPAPPPWRLALVTSRHCAAGLADRHEAPAVQRRIAWP
jgi:hypothetical protein